MSNGNLNPLNDLSRLYLDQVAKINQKTEEIEKKRWEGELNLQMKTDAVKEEKKAKRWQDDDGDGKWYEKSDVDGKISKREKEEKKKAVKEHHQKDENGNTIPHEDKLLKIVSEIVNEEDCDCTEENNCGQDPCIDCGESHHNVEEGYGKKKAKKVKKESFSDWRTDLREIMTDDEDQKEIKEKNVKNKIKINPKLGEAIEEIGGEVLEAYTVTKADKKGNTPAWQGYKSGKKNVKTGKPLYKAADHLKNEEVEEFDESEKVAQGAQKRAEVLASRRRQKGYREKGYNAYRPGKNERAGYNLSRAARSSDASPETQRTKKKKPAGEDTSQIGHYKKRDEKQTVGKRGKPLKQPKYKLSMGQRVDHHSNKALSRRDPKQNPKHTANK